MAAKVELSDKMVSPSNCIELILEALSLAEQLHQSGFELTCPLELFLQAKAGRVSFVRVNPSDSSAKRKRYGGRRKETADYLSGEEVTVFFSFCQALLKWHGGDKESPQSHLGKLMATLEKAVKEDKRVVFRHLRKLLCEFRVEQAKWALSCYLNPIDGSLQVEIKDQQNHNTSIFREKGKGLVEASDAQMTAEELFFLLCTRKQKQLRITSGS